MPMQPAPEATPPLNAAARDLERLQALLADACETLLARFAGASAALRADPPSQARALDELHGAVTALQFQDLAQQLIAHAQRRLGDSASPQRPNPVAQTGVGAGSFELF